MTSKNNLIVKFRLLLLLNKWQKLFTSMFCYCIEVQNLLLSSIDKFAKNSQPTDFTNKNESSNIYIGD